VGKDKLKMRKAAQILGKGANGDLRAGFLDELFGGLFKV
jgi:hypothetical protein